MRKHAPHIDEAYFVPRGSKNRLHRVNHGQVTALDVAARLETGPKRFDRQPAMSPELSSPKVGCCCPQDSAGHAAPRPISEMNPRRFTDLSGML